jgi:pimeloyl-ACP methyl ester carboxylesterase
MPVVMLTGADDQVVDVNRQSRRLHEEISQSEFVSLAGLVHMVHRLAPDEVIRAVDRAAELSGASNQTRVVVQEAVPQKQPDQYVPA